jgi:CubicO group peptidase (beta-lactamase class C family)
MMLSLFPALFLLADACAVLPPTLVDPASIGLKPAPIAALVQAARAADTDGFAVLKDSKLIAAFNENKPYLIYSVTKPITGLAAGRLFTEGKWTNLDAPLSALLPAFATDPKGVVTLRQLMSHTSGIADVRDANGRVLKGWNQAKNWVDRALAQPLKEPPGTVYRYNNLGPALVAAAVEHAAQERLDKFLRRTVFDPLCIAKNTDWFISPAGQAAGYTGLSISAFDLAKLGQLILNQGRWGTETILSQDWVAQSAHRASQSVSPRVGLLWFLAPDPKFPLPLVIFHDGDGGQSLAIFPNHGIVVARLRKSGAGSEKQAMGDLVQLVANALIKEQAR